MKDLEHIIARHESRHEDPQTIRTLHFITVELFNQFGYTWHEAHRAVYLHHPGGAFIGLHDWNDAAGVEMWVGAGKAGVLEVKDKNGNLYRDPELNRSFAETDLWNQFVVFVDLNETKPREIFTLRLPRPVPQAERLSNKDFLSGIQPQQVGIGEIVTGLILHSTPISHHYYPLLGSNIGVPPRVSILQQ